MTEPLTAPYTAVLSRESVAAVQGVYAANQLRGLPWAFDDLTRDFGDDIYERMLLDAQVTAVVNILRAAIIEEGVRLECPIKDEEEDGYALGQEIEEFCESVLADLQIPLDDVLWDMLSAIALGSRVAEEVWTLKSATSYALPGTSPVSKTQDLLILSALKPRPRRSTAFVVDPYMNVQGLIAREATTTSTLTIPTLATDARQIPNLISRDKFAVLTFRPKDADPRGQPALRPAYTPWFSKMEIWQEFLRYLAQFASASIYAVASEAATNQGIRVEQSDGSFQIRPAVEVLADTLLAYRNGSALAVPYGTILGALQVSGNGEAFHNGFTLCDNQITIAVLNQSLATREAEHQARASSEVHENTLTTLQRQAKRSVCVMLHRDILTPLVAYNYGETAARQLTPTVSLGEVKQFDFASVAGAIAQLASSSYLDSSQFAGIDRMLNLPPRVVEEEPAGTDVPPPPPAEEEDQGQEENAGDAGQEEESTDEQ
jgi:hypothetical protein